MRNININSFIIKGVSSGIANKIKKTIYNLNILYSSIKALRFFTYTY